MNKKILVCVLSLEEEPYISLEKTIRETWASELHPDVVTNYNLEYPVISFEFQAAQLTAAPHNQKQSQGSQDNN